ncbi:MAG: regulatory protein RecX [Treponema sp.]|nr:regulatory protein RecX [Candidatus Treponema equifaecale]
MEENVLEDEAVKQAVIKAANSLARCEQCRAGLERKLLQKEFSKETIKIALDYMEEKGYLSDERYASCWVRNHCAFKFHGRIRVMKELLARGISRQIASAAVEEYFSVNDESEFCRKAYEKCVQQGKSEEKILKSLIDSGFSYKMIQQTMKSV